MKQKRNSQPIRAYNSRSTTHLNCLDFGCCLHSDVVIPPQSCGMQKTSPSNLFFWLSELCSYPYDCTVVVVFIFQSAKFLWGNKQRLQRIKVMFFLEPVHSNSFLSGKLSFKTCFSSLKFQWSYYIRYEQLTNYLRIVIVDKLLSKMRPKGTLSTQFNVSALF